MTPSPAARSTPLWLWILLALGVLAAAAGLWRALQQRSVQTQALAAQAALPPPLQIAANEWLYSAEHTLPLQLPVTGNVVAVRSAVVKARVAGALQDLQLREGEHVRQGQTVARVDATEAQARWQQARLQADAAQAQVDIQQRLHANNQALVQRGFISQTALATSAAQWQAAQANHAAARAAQDGAKKYLDDTVLRSPLSGQVARTMARNGEQVMPDAPVLEVVDLSSLEVQVQVAANDSALVQPDQTAQLQLSAPSPLATATAASAQTWAAQVVRINPSASPSNRSVTVYVQLPPQPGLTLRPGMHVNGWIALGQASAIAVPLDAVRTDRPSPYVQTVVDGQVQHHTVQLGAQAMLQGQPWVRLELLPPGVPVLTSQTGALAAGTRVQLQPHSPPAPPSRAP